MAYNDLLWHFGDFCPVCRSDDPLDAPVQFDYSDFVQWRELEVKRNFWKAHKGVIDAQILIGHCYMNGLCVEKNEKEAVKWFTLAADQGDSEALHTLASCYEYGIGVQRDYEKTIELYKKAIDRGNSLSACNLESFRNRVHEVMLKNKGIFLLGLSNKMPFGKYRNISIEQLLTNPQYRAFVEAYEETGDSAIIESGDLNSNIDNTTEQNPDTFPPQFHPYLIWLIENVSSVVFEKDVEDVCVSMDVIPPYFIEKMKQKRLFAENIWNTDDFVIEFPKREPDYYNIDSKDYYLPASDYNGDLDIDQLPPEYWE